MAYSESYTEFILDQLSSLDGITTRKMFGAIAIYMDDVLFAAVMEDKFTLRVAKDNEAKYLAAGMERHFIPNRKMKMPYFDVPINIIEDRDALIKWALTAYDESK